MASVAALNVRIGGDIKALEKALKDAERAVRTAGTRLSNIGNELSMKLSLPLLAFGAAAIKSAGEIEAIEKAMQATFQGAGRSIEEANAELVALRKAAEAPGLDFEQAVKASLRLQGVGFSAEKARNTIIQLANAISTTGGTAENLNGVTVQFAQIISKGKILTSDLNVIKENMPGLAKLMKETFGTTSAEDLRALGVNGQEFVEKITAAMQKLPRVEGGISNAIVNAGTAIKMFLANVGESLNKTFNVTGKLEAFSSWLSGLGEKFSGMSEGTQRAIVAVGVFVLALGPMIKVAQFGILAWGKYTAIMNMWQRAVLAAKVTGGLATLEFIEMNKAIRLTAIGATIGVVLAAVAAFALLRDQFDANTFAQEAFAKATKSVAEETSKERGELDKNFEVLKNVTSTNGERKAAIDALLNQYPEYFKGMNLEIQSVGKLTEIQAGLTIEIERSVAARKKGEAINEIYSKRADILKRIQELKDGGATTISEATLINTGDMVSAGSIAGAVIEKLQQQADGLKTSAVETGQSFDKAFGLVGAAARRASPASKIIAAVTEETDKSTVSTSLNTEETEKNTKAKKDQAKAWEEYVKWVHEVDKAQKEQDYKDTKNSNKPFESLSLPGTKTVQSGENKGDVENQVKSTEDTVKRFETAIDRMKKKVEEVRKAIEEGTATPMQKLIDWAAKFEEKLGGGLETAKEGIAAIGGLSDAISARNISNLNKEMEERLKGVKKGSALEAKIKEEFQAKIDAMERKAARRAKVLAIMEATITAAQGVLKGLAKGSIPGAVAAGAIGAIQIARIIATPLAKGGIASGPVHALVGEYPGAANNPEVIAPLDKLRGMLGSASSDVNVSGTFRVQGTDLLLVLEKAQRQRGRANGF